MQNIKRIVMLTPDIQIDRRIILEAESLSANGKEVIIIAGNNGKMPEYETIVNIKIRRPLYTGVDSRLLWMFRMQAWLSTVAARICALIRRVLVKVGL